MSVKLPLILKRQPIKPSPQVDEHPPKRLPSQEEKKYQNDEFEDDVLKVEPAQPLQTIIVLKKHEEPVGKLETHIIEKKEEEPQPSPNHPHHREELLKIAEEKTQLTATLKESVTERKKEIKGISQQIDKDLNKSLLRTVKPNTVSIRDIFSVPPKTDNKRINDLNDQLKTVRIAIKKIKTDIQKITDCMMDPVIVLNQEKGIDFQGRMRSVDDDICKVEKEKQMLSEEIARGNGQYNEEEEIQRADELGRLNATLTEVLVAQKECKGSIYLIDKEDVLHMEKIKFFQEKDGAVGLSKKSKPSEKDKLKMDEEIRQLIIDINRIIEQRNKIESDKKSNIKNLITEISSLESKNWELCSKLREIDSYLLQYYEKKAKKKQVKNITDKEGETQVVKCASGRIETHHYHETPIKAIDHYENDKNKRPAPAEIVLTQKKKNYDFSFNQQPDEEDIQLSDEFLGSKLNILKLVIAADQHKIFRIQAHYEASSANIEGYMISSKKVPETAKVTEFILDRETLEIINFIHVGYSENHFISYLQIVTTNGREYKWGSPDHSVKSDQKHIKKYEFGCLKGRLSPSAIPEEEGMFFLSGVGLSTIYLSAK